MRHSRLVVAGHALLAAAPVLLLVTIGLRPFSPGPVVHFWLVVEAAGLAAAASVPLSVVGTRFRDGRAILLGTGLSTMTALLAIHGLATPGIIVGQNGVIAFAGALALPAGVAILGLTALPPLRRPRRVGPLLALQGSLAAVVVALGVVGLLVPSFVPAVPSAKSLMAHLLLAGGLGGLVMLIARAVRTYLLTRRARDLTVAVGCAWLGCSLVAQLELGYMTAGFYIGHCVEVGGIALIAVPAALDLLRGGPSRPLVGDLTAAELVASEEAYLGPRVRALVVQLTERDTSTAEHTRRVALLAARVGAELKLPPATQRHLAVGGLLHDIGKLSVPLAILRKPAALSDDEYSAVKRHPEAGRRLLEELGGFSPTVRSLVSDHHERLDGTGYPRGLRAEELPLHTRVLTVCDVYDALVSDRIYRAAWSPQQAFELLRAEAGSAFDERCVDALGRVLGCTRREPGWVADVTGAQADRAAPRGAYTRPWSAPPPA